MSGNHYQSLAVTDQFNLGHKKYQDLKKISVTLSKEEAKIRHALLTKTPPFTLYI